LERKSGQNEYYLSDALGSVIGLTDPTGAIKTSYNYSPFGKKQTTGAASSNPFAFTGREDDGTGYYYYRARYYSPDQKRFIGEDPLEFGSGDTNFYAYIGGNPVNFTDPMGLSRSGRTGSSCSLARVPLQAGVLNKEPGEGSDLAEGGNLTGGFGGGGFGGGYSRGGGGSIGAENPELIKLNKSLASDEQMSQEGKILAGKGGRVPFRDAQRIADQYGGHADDWVKKGTSPYTARDKSMFEIHWVENIHTGQRVEFKTKFIEKK
jgi:RHS repeat-associated protein